MALTERGQIAAYGEIRYATETIPSTTRTRRVDTPDPPPVVDRSHRKLDPPVRRSFINNLPPHQRATALIRGHVESRVGCKDATESAACRAFLKAYHRVMADGNKMGVDLAVMHAGRGSVQFYFNIHGVGPVTWLPVLVTGANEKTAQIMRETGPSRVAIAPPAREHNPDDEPGRKRIPPKTETFLVRGKRI